MPIAIRPHSSLHPRRLARTAMLVAAAMAVAGAAFWGALRFGATPPPPGPAAAGDGPGAGVVESIEPPDARDMPFQIGPGERPWMVAYEGGQPTTRFRARQYTQGAGGTVDVSDPVAEFFVGHGEVLRLTGDTGEVSLGTPPAGGSAHPAAPHAPDTGTLHHVVIERFPTTDTAGHPTLTIRVNNVRFDNGTLRLFTEPYVDADGTTVPADRVPVTVRGDDYEMDGQGLTLRWNGRDRHLHLLEIAHGHRLTILHPDRATAAGPAPVASAAVASVAVASADPAAVVLAVPAAKGGGAKVPLATLPVVPPIPYRATFQEAVRVVQAGQTLATGDALALEFLQGRSAAAATTTRPATGPVAAGGGPGLRSTSDAGLATAPTTAPVVAATRPARAEPVTIYWHGKLRVTPLEQQSPMMPLAGGQAAVRLVGGRATLAYNGGTADVASATYRTGDHALRMEPSAACPVVTLRQKGTTLECRGVAFDPVPSVATIAGPATLTVAGKAGPPLTVTWADRGLLHVTGTDAALSGIDHVDLAGDVHATDPSRYAMASRRLLLDFDEPPATRPATPGGKPAEPALRRLTAVGDAHVRTLRDGQAERAIDGERLTVDLVPDADGHPSPRTVFADGHVRVSDPQQAMEAEHVEATLDSRPSTRPTTGPADAVTLDSLKATGGVRAVLKNGARVEADTLREQTAADGRQLVQLSGERPVKVTSGKGDRLEGSVLRLAVGPTGDVITVDGPGKLSPAGKPATRPTDAPPRAIDVAWSDGLAFDTAANRADVVGHVLARTVDANGTVTTAAGDVARLDLADAAPPAKGATTTRPAVDDGDLGRKALRQLTLVGHVTAESKREENGATVRYGRLAGDRLVYTAAGGVLRVPGPGTLFVENHAAADTKAGGGNRGAMAIRWRDGLTYDSATNRVVITGDARVGFQQDQPPKPAAGAAANAPVQMIARELVIETKKATAGKAAAAGGTAEKGELSRLTATGAVHVRARGLEVDCHAADYDPATGRLVLSGSAAEPGRGVSSGDRPNGNGAGVFDTLVFDTKRQEIVGGTGVGGAFRR